MVMTPRLLETHCEWRAEDVADPTAWTELLTQAECDEIAARRLAVRGLSFGKREVSRSLLSNRPAVEG